MTSSSDWEPQRYEKFAAERRLPFDDLVGLCRPTPGGVIYDLGCGTGARTIDLPDALGAATVIGIDTSNTMLERTRAYDDPRVSFVNANIANFQPDHSPDVILSNAALHWLDDHAKLMPQLVSMLGKGGTLAVQLPHQNNAPSHRVWLTLAEELFPEQADAFGTPGVLTPIEYDELLAPLGTFRLWETEYYQRLTAETGSHPVRRYTESTYARPILTALDATEKAALIKRYEDVMHKAYPVRSDGTVLFPFRRMFFTLTV